VAVEENHVVQWTWAGDSIFFVLYEQDNSSYTDDSNTSNYSTSTPDLLDEDELESESGYSSSSNASCT
jgi:hypothetical protein